MAKTELKIPEVNPGAMARVNAELALAGQAAGVELGDVHIPDQHFAYPLPLDALCTLTWAKLPKALVSPPMVVKTVSEFPEADRFEGYKGFIRCEAFLPSGEFVAWSTHLYNKTTGELGPVAEVVRELPLPFAIRIGSFETSTPGRRVFRPVPLQEP